MFRAHTIGIEEMDFLIVAPIQTVHDRMELLSCGKAFKNIVFVCAPLETVAFLCLQLKIHWVKLTLN